MKINTYSKKDFEWTQWDAKTIRSYVPKIIAHKKDVYSLIKKIPKEQRTFENTVYAIEASDYPFDHFLKAIDVLSMVSPDDAVRKTAQEVMKELNKKFVDIEYDPNLYRAVKEYVEYGMKKEKLLDDEKKLLKDAMKSYKRMGFDLPKEKRDQLKKIFKSLSKLGNDFSNNLNEYKDHILVSRKELSGLPDHFIEGLSREKDSYKVTLEYPDFGPFMRRADDDKKRMELADKGAMKGGVKNLNILTEMVNLRDKKAKILGYKSHADFVTENRMVKNFKTANDFINNLAKKVAKGTKKDIQDLLELKRKTTGDDKAELYYYDISYYAERLQGIRFKFDSEKIREYFPFEKVIDGTFFIYQKLFGVKFKEIYGIPTWHEDVKVYSVLEKGKPIAYFMLDLYPRPNKYGHACAIQIIPTRDATFRSEERIAPVGAMITNFPKPRKGVPSLLSHDEVNTFFHEFGHVMHVVLSKTHLSSQAGYNVVWDFAEAPSQMLENWVFDKKMISYLSKHYKTGKPLPEKDLKNLIASKKHLICYDTMRQLSMSAFDLFIHSKKPNKPLNKISKEVSSKFTGIPSSPKSLFPANFGHLAGGYDAGYYGYMWSKVYASDMFTRFQKEGLLNPKTGGDYRKWILEKGSSMEEIDLVKRFLKRAPNNKAFLKEIGAV